MSSSSVKSRNTFNKESSSMAILYKAIFDSSFIPNEQTTVFLSNYGKGDGVLAQAAASSGARFVYCFEPWVSQQRSIWMAARLNGVADRIRIIPAILHDDPAISFSMAIENDVHYVKIFPNDSEIGHIEPKAPVSSMRLDETGPISNSKILIAFWHIPESDSGLELRQLMSARKLLKARQFRHIVLSSVGPPSKWKNDFANMTSSDALNILNEMSSWGYDLQVLPGLGMSL
ncbi:hypothetical protein HK096_001534 [Nowakowskiella sp. JEL0078]|nr:hypothetical protein HK096_001534 [Nowakowskiella sp. JEL0078]